MLHLPHYSLPLFTLICCVGAQVEMETRMELERRLKLAEEALQRLEQGLTTLEPACERNERMRGDVGHLKSE